MATSPELLPDSEEFARMEHALFSRIERSHDRKVRVHRLGAAAIVIGLAAGGGGVAAVTQANNRQQITAAFCYESATASSPASETVMGRKIDHTKPLTAKAFSIPAMTAAKANSSCAAAWRQGIIRSTVRTAPHLQACVRNDQVYAVFPRRHIVGTIAQFCESLGMSAPY